MIDHAANGALSIIDHNQSIVLLVRGNKPFLLKQSEKGTGGGARAPLIGESA